ncbi:glycoside hydrolase family 2 protein [Paenibacillaceae bacterium WGS1546]|uniref:beta-mannosidase n=1 Tax=Cohnella sp. WGS1546 TaxID=3366810 RepID=UPI00372D56A4
MTLSITLADAKWHFRMSEDEKWLEARVPGCVHTDLLRNGKIPDPFYGANEKDVQWIDKKDWEYEAEFAVPEALLREERIELVFDGLDTYADVSLNGRPLLSANNMFRTWAADAKPWLKAGANRLRVLFRSPVKVDLPKLEKLGYPLPAANDQSDVGELGDRKISVFARKAPYHYGWDWGPRFVTSGIWKDVRLEGWSGVRIKDVYIRQDEVTADVARLTAIVEAEAAAAWAGRLRLRTDGGLGWEREVRLAPGIGTLELALEIASPRLWWSRGLGEPSRYTFVAELADANGPLAEKTVLTGLRTVRLVREADEGGTGFYFELNGIPVFAKGANHIPNDSFLTEVGEDRYRHEIVSAVESNMNMLRVWGGGVYESDLFYDLCDEYGLLVWQDFMFACSMYPGDEAFLSNVRAEAEEQIKRLRRHPSIVLWCGNNEIDIAWSHYDEDLGWGWKKEYTPEQREKMWADYRAIFHRLLPEAVESLHADIGYWPSSPLASPSGDESQHARTTSTDGDMHYWGVWHNVEPFDQYNRTIGRFMSEYGFQSFPEYRTVRAYAEEADLRLDSEVMLRHQKNGQGNQLIKQYMDMYMPEPRDFPSFLYMSQVLQAEAMKTAIEAHRRSRPYCMGSLYWQMNDCWPVASWSSMDYYGRWKATQYYARRSFRDIIVIIGEADGGRLNVHLVSDRPEPFSGRLELRLTDFSGAELWKLTGEAASEANSAKLALSLDRSELLGGRDVRSLVLSATLADADGTPLDEKTHYFAPIKELALQDPGLRIVRGEDGKGSFFMLECDSLAKQVHLASGNEGTFDDNFFDLLPGRPVTVRFYAKDVGADGRFAPGPAGVVEVRSMFDYV